MSFNEAQLWQLPIRQGPWEQPPTPSRSGTGSVSQQEEDVAFHSQIEEVDRAIDNLSKSGKLFSLPARRDSMPLMAGPRAFSEFDPRMGGIPQRHHSISDYDQTRPHSGSNLQSFYAMQRHQPRPNEAEQMMQAKRRMAAQRERELRNYHQEQQYNRNVSSQNKSDRAISPNAMNEEDRRELIARQHRALYGNESGSLFENLKATDDSHTPRPGNQSAGASNPATGGRGASPRTFDPYTMGQGQVQGQGQTEVVEAANQVNESEQGQHNASSGPSPKPQQERSRGTSNSSPASNNQNFSLFESATQQTGQNSASSPGESPPRQGKPSAPNSGGVAPIGTRPAQAQAVNPALSKRSTTPLPSPLSFGFAPNDGLSAGSNGNERSTSAASNPSSGAKESGLAWGSSSGVWGNKNPLGVQASVWG
ncbi:MAG: hypothetical protein LQ342_000195 [Letrouitia transgressa]|nr:MAG: hypothetical protein LQ342_000195 [Letrouitia transgressa]